MVAEPVAELGELERLVDGVGHGAAAAHRSPGEDAEPKHLVDPLLPALPLLLAKDELLHLAGRRLRQVAELDGRRALEVRDVLAAELDDLRLGGPLPRLQGDERLGPLAPLVVRDRDHRALEDGRMARDALLDLDGRDVLAAPRD